MSALGLLFIVLLVLKLTHMAALTWLAVWSPLLIWLAVWLIYLGAIAILEAADQG